MDVVEGGGVGEQRPGRGRWLWYGVGVVFLLTGLGGTIVAFDEVRTVLAERNWPRVPATILSSSWDAEGPPDRPYRFRVRYRYTYEGRVYQGSAYRRDWRGESEFARIQRLLLRYPAGTQTTCRVDPTQPGRAVLLPQPLVTAVVPVLFSLLFAIVGGVLLVSGLRHRPEGLLTSPITAGRWTRRRRTEVLVGMIAMGAGLGLVGLMAPWVAGPLRARNWIAVPATVVAATVREHRGTETTTHRIDILYRYTYAGRTYLANRYDFIGGSSSGAEAKWRVVRRHPPGSRVTTWIDPDDPVEAVLVRGYTARHLLVLFPLTLVLIGLLLIRRAWNAPVSVLPGEVGHATASRLLRPSAQRLELVVGLFLFALLWNGPVAFFLLHELGRLGGGSTDGLQLLGLVPLLVAQLIGIGVVIGLGYALLALLNPRTTIQLTPASPRLGERLRITWQMHGRVRRLRRLRIRLVGQEYATYRGAKSTHTRTETFRRIEVVDLRSRAEMRAGTAELTFPEDTMHSFHAQWNGIQWQLEVTGEIARWPDVHDAWEIEIRPRSPREEWS